MRQLGKQPCFVLKHAQRMFVFGVVREQPLDHDIAKEAALTPLSGQKNLCHAACCNLMQ
jgi:hypothetical protein